MNARMAARSAARGAMVQRAGVSTGSHGALSIQRRMHMNGYSLFARYSQRRAQGAKRARMSSVGNDLVAAKWHSLRGRDKRFLNEAAREVNNLRVRRSAIYVSPFNLLMQAMFREKRIARDARDFTFAVQIARRTLQSLTAPQLARLRKSFNLSKSSAAVSEKYPDVPISRKSYYPNMKYFVSFVDMLQCVAPTRAELFIAVSRVFGQLPTLSAEAVEELAERSAALAPEEKSKFLPIAPGEESCFFEVFCAARCARLNPRAFAIIELFAEFRNWQIAKSSSTGEVEVQYRLLMRDDRFREGVYFKALRNLLRAEAKRTSDMGRYALSLHPAPVHVPARVYRVKSQLSDTEIAAHLAMTRYGCSVYDDVLRRTSCFRSEASNRALAHAYTKYAIEEPALVETAAAPRYAHALRGILQQRELDMTLKNEEVAVMKAEKAPVSRRHATARRRTTVQKERQQRMPLATTKRKVHQSAPVAAATPKHEAKSQKRVRTKRTARAKPESSAEVEREEVPVTLMIREEEPKTAATVGRRQTKHEEPQPARRRIKLAAKAREAKHKPKVVATRESPSAVEDADPKRVAKRASVRVSSKRATATPETSLGYGLASAHAEELSNALDYTEDDLVSLLETLGEDGKMVWASPKKPRSTATLRSTQRPARVQVLKVSPSGTKETGVRGGSGY